MKIIPLNRSNRVDSFNSYLILGDRNQIDDVNTIIDPVSDDYMLHEIEMISSGLGRLTFEQIILTDNHPDHNRAALNIKEQYKAKVLAYHNGPGVDELLKDGQFIKAGDDILEVLHTPGHSSDSICLYTPSEKALFSGNTQLRIMGSGEYFTQEYIIGLLKIACRDVQRIYSGHDNPILGGCNELILQSLRNVQGN